MTHHTHQKRQEETVAINPDAYTHPLSAITLQGWINQNTGLTDRIAGRDHPPLADAEHAEIAMLHAQSAAAHTDMAALARRDATEERAHHLRQAHMHGLLARAWGRETPWTIHIDKHAPTAS